MKVFFVVPAGSVTSPPRSVGRTRPLRERPSRTRRPARARSARGCSRSRRSCRAAGSRRREQPRCSALTSGIEPPVATKTGSLPQADCQRLARSVVRGAGCVREEARARCADVAPSSSMPNGRSSSKCRTRAACASLRVLLRMDAKAELARAVGTTALTALSTGQHVDPGDRHRRARPEPLPQASGAHERHVRAGSLPARGTRRRCRTRPSTPRAAARRRRRRRARRASSRARE